MLPANRYETERAALEDRAHAVGHGVRVAVWAPRGGELLELVEEEDEPPPVRARNALGQLERQVERALGVARREPRRERDLDALPQLAHHLQHRLRLGGGQRSTAGAARSPQRPVGGGAVGDHRGGESLSQLGRVGYPEQVDLGGVGAAPREPGHGRLAHARLAGAPWAPRSRGACRPRAAWPPPTRRRAARSGVLRAVENPSGTARHSRFSRGPPVAPWVHLTHDLCKNSRGLRKEHAG